MIAQACRVSRVEGGQINGIRVLPATRVASIALNAVRVRWHTAYTISGQATILRRPSRTAMPTSIPTAIKISLRRFLFSMFSFFLIRGCTWNGKGR